MHVPVSPSSIFQGGWRRRWGQEGKKKGFLTGATLAATFPLNDIPFETQSPRAVIRLNMKTTRIHFGLCLLLGATVAHAAPDPVWQNLSSKRGELPAPPGGSTEQTGAVVADFDGDGVNDFILSFRQKAPALVWYRRNATGWDQYVIEKDYLTIEAGGAVMDIDGDGDMDVVFGGDWQSKDVWWWENPSPNFDKNTSWKRHLIKTGGMAQHHDQVFGDFLGTGKPQLAFWNQQAKTLFLAEIPADPRSAGSWPLTEVVSGTSSGSTPYTEGMSAFDIDADGKVDLLAFNTWYKHTGGKSFKAIKLSDVGGLIFAGYFKPSKYPQIVISPGDVDGPLRWYECVGNPENAEDWKAHELLDRNIVHGHTLQLGDINRDGHLDIFAAEMAKWHEKETVRDHPEATGWIFYGDGQGNFTRKEVVVGHGWHEARLADLDGDGDLDLLNKPYNWDAPRVDVWLNQVPKHAAAGPLRVHPANPRYFTDGKPEADGSLRAVYLTGSHTWNSVQDVTGNEWFLPNLISLQGYEAYLDFLVAQHHNFIRLWMVEHAWNAESGARIAPHPWLRTGPGDALDGRRRFDLSKFDPAYFERLRARAIAARDRGIYVSVMLFGGMWGTEHKSTWAGHPFNAANNINDIDGDADHDGTGNELYTLKVPPALAFQKATATKVVETLNDLDNVLYEVANEVREYSTAWQYEILQHVGAVEARQPNQHPVGMTGYDSIPHDDLLRSSADWISPSNSGGDYRENPPPADGKKVVLTDTDHLWGEGGNPGWVWRSFTRGLHPIWMERVRLGPGDLPQAGNIRRAMGQTLRLAERLNLANMIPHGELVSSGYCLADPANAYVIYLPEDGEVTVDLSAATGELAVEWIHPIEGKTTPAKAMIGGAKRTFKAPFPGSAVLHLAAKPRKGSARAVFPGKERAELTPESQGVAPAKLNEAVAWLDTHSDPELQRRGAVLFWHPHQPFSRQSRME